MHFRPQTDDRKRRWDFGLYFFLMSCSSETEDQTVSLSDWMKSCAFFAFFASYPRFRSRPTTHSLLTDWAHLFSPGSFSCTMISFRFLFSLLFVRLLFVSSCSSGSSSSTTSCSLTNKQRQRRCEPWPPHSDSWCREDNNNIKTSNEKATSSFNFCQI